MKRLKFIALAVVLVVSAAFFGCDSVVPEDEGNLVVNAFFDTGQPLPPVRVTRTRPLSIRLSEPFDEAVDATVLLELDGVIHTYVADDSRSGTFIPAPESRSVVATAGARYRLTVETQDDSAIARGILPSKLNLTDIRISIADEPISAVFVDTLDIGLDSLNLRLNASTGFIIPVQVSVSWESAISDEWIETRLDPVTAFASPLIDFFFLPSQVFPENNALAGLDGRRTWSGVYAVPVDSREDSLPEHSLKVTLLRSSEEFAQFATSRDSPARREPVSNVDGAIGFVGGVSIDSVRVTVGN